MKKIGLFYATTTGNTAGVAELIKDELGSDVLEMVDIGMSGVEGIGRFDSMILGCATKGLGDLDDDWEIRLSELGGDSVRGKKVALFGLGDQDGYPDTFVDAMGVLHSRLEKLGAVLVGPWSTEGYSFSASKAVTDGRFVGLALDQENQPDLTGSRVKNWVASIRGELLAAN